MDDVCNKIAAMLSEESLSIIRNMDVNSDAERAEEDLTNMRLEQTYHKLSHLNNEILSVCNIEEKDLISLQNLKDELLRVQSEMKNSVEPKNIDMNQLSARISTCKAKQSSTVEAIDVVEIENLHKEIQELQTKNSRLKADMKWAQGLPPSIIGAKRAIEDLQREIEILKSTQERKLAQEVSFFTNHTQGD